jgi:capsular exopolysaccharide synthesis family protein
MTAPANMLTSETLFALFRRHVKLFALIFGSIFALTLLITFLQTPRYEATARVLVDPRRQNLMPTNPDIMSGLPPKDQSAIDTEVETLYSPALTRQVVRDLKLASDPEFGNAYNNVGEAADTLSSALDISRVGETYLIDIGVKSTDPAKAAKIANSFADNYILFQLQVKRSVNKLSTDLLAERVKGMADKVKLAEIRVQQFKIENGLMSVNGATLAEQSIASIDGELARAKADELEAFGRLSSAQAAGARLDASTSQALQDLRGRYASAQQELREAQLKYGEKHPTYQAAVARSNELERAVEAETRRANAALIAQGQQQIDKLRAEAAAAAQKRVSLAASVNTTREALTSTNRAQVALNDLLRDAEALRLTYQSYLNRYQETLTRQGTETADARIVSNAFVPREATSPNVKLFLAFGLLLGVGTAVAAIILLTMLDPRLSTAADIEKYLDLDALPSIATVESTIDRDRAGALSLDPAQHVIAHPQTVFTEQFRNLLNAIRKPNASGRARIVALTSSLPNEGKTTTSICLARVAAMSGLGTVIVDCDLRHRSLNRFVPDTSKPGLIEYLRGEATLHQVLQLDEASGAMILSASIAPSRTSDNLGGERMKELLTALHAAFDIVILDTPPVLPLADARMLASLADGVVMIARWRATSRRAVEAALGILAHNGAEIMGVSLTMADLRKMSSEGYGDPSFYYSHYKDYYSEEPRYERPRQEPTPELRKTA